MNARILELSEKHESHHSLWHERISTVISENNVLAVVDVFSFFFPPLSVASPLLRSLAFTHHNSIWFSCSWATVLSFFFRKYHILLHILTESVNSFLSIPHTATPLTVIFHMFWGSIAGYAALPLPLEHTSSCPVPELRIWFVLHLHKNGMKNGSHKSVLSTCTSTLTTTVGSL